MSKLLFNEQPLVVDKELAVLIGLNEAIVLQQIHYWLQINEKANKNYYDGRYWTYNTIEEWTEEFKFWSYETVKRTLSKLRKLNIIITGNYNKKQMDRTLWYTIDYTLLEKMKEENNQKNSETIENSQKVKTTQCYSIKDKKMVETDTKQPDVIQESNKNYAESVENSQKVILPQWKRSKRPNALEQKDPLQKVILTRPIPEITTKISNTYSQSVSQDEEENIKKDGRTDMSKNIQESNKKYFNPNTLKMLTCEELHKYISEEIKAMKYNNPWADMIQNAVTDIIYSDKMIKQNDKEFRRQYVIRLCDINIIDYAINKFKSIDISSIKNPHGYFSTVLYTAIFEYSANEALLESDIEKIEKNLS